MAYLSNRLYNIASWNANGTLRKTKPEIEKFCDDYSIAILLIQETHLSASRSFNLRGYFIYRDDRTGRAGGGTAIAIRRSLPHTRLTTPPLNSIEATIVEIGTATGPIKFISAYRSPSSPLQADDLTTLLNPGSTTVLGGDINSKRLEWGCKTNTTAGNILYQFLEMRQDLTLQPPSGPTYLQNHLPFDILDFIIHSSTLHPTVPKPLNELNSDHLPIISALSIGAFPYTPFPSFSTKTEWKLFRDRIAHKIRPHKNPLRTPDEIDRVVEKIEFHIRSAYNINTTRIPKTNGREQLPSYIISLIQERRRAQRRFYASRDPVDKSIFQTTRRAVSQLLRAHREAEWSKFISKAEIKDRTDLWKIQKILKNPASPLTALNDNVNKTITYDPLRQAEIFATTLQRRFTPLPTHTYAIKNGHYLPVPDILPQNYEDCLFDNTTNDEDEDIPTFSEDQIREQIKKTKCQ